MDLYRKFCMIIAATQCDENWIAISFTPSTLFLEIHNVINEEQNEFQNHLEMALSDIVQHLSLNDYAGKREEVEEEWSSKI